MRRQWVEGAVGRGQELDPESVEERARPEVLLRQAGRDLVVDRVGVLRPERFLHAEDLLERVVEPELRRRAPEEA